VKLVVIRHGPAGNREAWDAEGHDDRARPLTPAGKKQTRRAVAGLATLVQSIDILASSLLVRAKQTAEVVADEFEVEVRTLDVLAPDRDPADTARWLREQPADTTIAIVGHEPHLSTLVGYLLTGNRVSFITLKKAGACLLELADPVELRSGTLDWLLTPRQLEKLGR
jgi:phosphohistidine phosphatase